MPYPKNAKYILAIIILCFASRLPQLLDSGLMLDGDECVIALMAKHAHLGEGLPLFFWGQNYGFSLIEVLFIIPFYSVLGYTTLAVKLAMLSLWTIGVVCLYKTMLAINSGNRVFAFILILLFIFCPTWSNWSMEARGGYLTSFTVTSLALCLLYTQSSINEYARFAIIGVCVYVVHISQPFWLVGLLPLAVYQTVIKKKVGLPLIAIVGLMATHFLILAINTKYESVYAVHPNLSPGVLLGNIARFPTYLYQSLQGNYSFAWYQDAPAFHRVYALTITVVFFVVVILSLLHLILKKTAFKQFIVSTLYMPLVFAYSLTSDDMQGRYLLPVLGFLLISVFLYYDKLWPQKALNKFFIGLVALAAVSTMIFPAYFNDEPNMKDLKTTLAHLKKYDIKYLYSTNTMLPWEVMFYSDEKILCRMPYFPGRYPKYDTMVDRAFYAGEKTAVIGYWRQYGGLALGNLDFENHYFISRNPTKQMLEKVFEFPLKDTFSTK